MSDSNEEEESVFGVQDHNYFLLKAIYDIYGYKLEDEDSDVKLFLNCGNMEKLLRVENKVAKRSDQNILSITRRTLSVKKGKLKCLNWKCNIELATNSKRKPSFSVPLVTSSCSFNRKFGDHRFLIVTISLQSENEERCIPLIFPNACRICKIKIPAGDIAFGFKKASLSWSFTCLGCRTDGILSEGIDFAGSKYVFLGGAMNADFERFDCWFFSVSFTRDGASIALPYTVKEARNWLADFDSIESAFKCNARLKLGFSPTYPCFDLTDSDVILWDDVISECGGSNGIMTDGCGLIHSSLAERIPYAICSGISACERDPSLQREGLGLPLVVQIRLAAKKGLFKGCLIVTSDTTLCPEGKIVVRPSMKKASGAKHIRHNTPCTLAVNNTFEHAHRVKFDLPFRDYHAFLSRQLCLYLVHLGVPESRFVALMQEELERVINAIRDKAAAKSLILRSLEKSEHAMQQNDFSYDEKDDHSDDDWDKDDGDDCEYEPHRPKSNKSPMLKQLSALHNTAPASVALKAWNFFKCGHDLSESVFCNYLNYLQKQQLEKLKKLNLRINNAQYLVGVPDPYNVLEEGMIFLSLPGDFRKSSHHSEEEAFYKQPPTVEGKVIVSKNPMNYVGDVRVLEAVYNEKLAALIRGTNGGAIFFSTRGARRIADEMGGGDYDGDLFIVMFDPGDELVQRVTAVAPYVDCRAPAKAKSATDLRRDDVVEVDEDENEDEDEESGKEGEKLGEMFQWKNESASSEGNRFTGTTKKYKDIDSMVTDLVKELNYIKSVNSNDLLSSVRKVETIPQPRAPSPSNGPFSSSSITSLDQLFAGMKIEEAPFSSTCSKSPPSLPDPIVPFRSIASSLPPPPGEKFKFKAPGRCPSAPQQDPYSQEVDTERVDLMGKKMLCALFRLRSKLTIGMLSNACLSFADSLGPEHEDAKKCDEFLRILLDCAKTGDKLPPEADDLYKKYWDLRPHYLEPVKRKRDQLLQSKSVVGILFDMVDRSCDELNNSKEWKVDKQMLCMHEVQCNLNTPEGVNEWRKEIHQWKDLCSKYRKGISDVLKYRKGISDVLNREEIDKRSQQMEIDDIVAEYIKKFDEAAEILSERYRGPSSTGYELLLSRKVLAIIVYYVTYNCEKQNEFCWKLCSNELHSHKAEALKIAEKVSPLSPMLPSMEPFLR